jgi:glycosyltransferase involved in cell wall biosynthesis
MKIGYICSVFMETGGTEIWAKTLMPSIKNLSIFCVYNVEIVRNYNQCEKKNLNWLPENIHKCYGIEGAIKCFKECDLVIMWGIFDVEEMINKSGRKPILIHVIHEDISNKWFKSILTKNKKFLDSIVAVHPDVAKYYKCKWIPNGIDENRIKTTSKLDLIKKYKLKNKKICFWCARYAAEKNPSIAIKIANKLPKNWVMVMAGNAPQEVKNNFKNKIIFPGVIDSPGEWLSISSCFLSTSSEEGFGLSIGEAMLAKVPVVGTPFGLCSYPNVCKTFQINNDLNYIVKLITEESCSKTIEAAYKLANSFSVEKQTESWNDLIANKYSELYKKYLFT